MTDLTPPITFLSFFKTKKCGEVVEEEGRKSGLQGRYTRTSVTEEVVIETTIGGIKVLVLRVTVKRENG